MSLKNDLLEDFPQGIITLTDLDFADFDFDSLNGENDTVLYELLEAFRPTDVPFPPEFASTADQPLTASTPSQAKDAVTAGQSPSVTTSPQFESTEAPSPQPEIATSTEQSSSANSPQQAITSANTTSGSPRAEASHTSEPLTTERIETGDSIQDLVWDSAWLDECTDFLAEDPSDQPDKQAPDSLPSVEVAVAESVSVSPALPNLADGAEQQLVDLTTGSAYTPPILPSPVVDAVQQQSRTTNTTSTHRKASQAVALPPIPVADPAPSAHPIPVSLSPPLALVSPKMPVPMMLSRPPLPPAIAQFVVRQPRRHGIVPDKQGLHEPTVADGFYYSLGNLPCLRLPRSRKAIFYTGLEFEPSLRFTSREFYEYIKYGAQLLGGGRRPILRIQMQPGGRNHRYTRGDKALKCRFASCSDGNGTITEGQARVCVQEFEDERGDWLDPYHNVGYVHLCCLERRIDIIELFRNPAIDLRLELRQFNHEHHSTDSKPRRNNPMALDMSEQRVLHAWIRETSPKWDAYVLAYPNPQNRPRLPLERDEKLCYRLAEARADRLRAENSHRKRKVDETLSDDKGKDEDKGERPLSRPRIGLSSSPPSMSLEPFPKRRLVAATRPRVRSQTYSPPTEEIRRAVPPSLADPAGAANGGAPLQVVYVPVGVYPGDAPYFAASSFPNGQPMNQVFWLGTLPSGQPLTEYAVTQQRQMQIAADLGNFGGGLGGGGHGHGLVQPASMQTINPFSWPAPGNVVLPNHNGQNKHNKAFGNAQFPVPDAGQWFGN